MLENKKKKKKRHHYILLCVSDAPKAKVKKYKFSIARINFLKVITAILFILLLGYVLFTSYHNTITLSNETTLRQKVSDLEKEKTDLITQNAELTEKVAILSETVNQKMLEEKALQEKNMPTGFPLSGTADMQEMEEEVELSNGKDEVRPLILFEAEDGIFAVAAGAGIITEVEMDLEYGYRIRIDHGNGYETIYRNGTEPKVKPGDEVARNALLFELKEDDDNELADIMAYQILKDGKYIVPTEILEING